MDGNPPTDGVTITILVGGNLKTHPFNMVEMSNTELVHNDVNETEVIDDVVVFGRCSKQREPVRQSATARMKWYKQMNIVVMECYYRS